ncbi:MAG: M20 family metallopeptidase [Proteobacteria bacterium]|nr:M20 family metallopeptidase [Pseudomonadota bacterium]
MNIQQQISTFLKERKTDMLTLLNELVCIQSGTKNKSGVDRVGQVILREMKALGFTCEQKKDSDFGNHIIARSPGFDSGKKQVLITGHMDTVFPHDTGFNFFKQDHKNCYGPGVADMKGGLVVGIFALKSLVRANFMHRLPVTFIFNSDEEMGSPSSRSLIQNEARKSKIAFVLEAGGLNGEIVTGRKGNVSVQLDVTGEAGHAAFAGIHKASAILELAHKTIAIEKLNAPQKGISANVGMIAGGIGPNTVPQHASARIDFRFLKSTDQNDLESGFTSICNQIIIPGTSSTMTIVSSRPAMPETKRNLAVFQKIHKLAKSLDIQIISELRQGVSDANLIAYEGIPVIDGLGPIGAKDHSEDEYIQTKSLFDRSVLFGNILANLCLD